MKLRPLFVAALGFAAAQLSTPAQASADSTCYPQWKLRHTTLSGCSSTALLGPGNDTRVNLLMLLADRHGAVGTSHVPNYDDWVDSRRRGEAQPFNYPYFAARLGPGGDKQAERSGDFPWGTRCMSNENGAADFIAALGKARGIRPAEAATLAAARTALRPQCVAGDQARAIAAVALENVASKTGKAFAAYLLGAAAFYDGDFAGAEASFAPLAGSGDKWLAGTARYMLGRTALNRAMEGAFDDYGWLNKDAANAAALAAAENGFSGYLKTYPAGDYAASARGLLRRVYWLGQDRARLAAAYSAAFAERDAAGRNVSLPDLVQEADIKLLADLKPGETTDPELLAVLLLRDMRYFEDDAALVQPLTRGALDGYRARFAARPELFDYLRAAHAYFVANDPAETLRLLPANSAGSGYFAFSQRLLRAVALDATNDSGARAALVAAVGTATRPFQRGAAELALALHLERTKALDRVFAAGSPIADAEIREQLLRYAAGPALLRARAADPAAPPRERDTALYALLYKQLMHGDYAGFVTNSALVPAHAKRFAADDYESPRFTEIAVFNWAGSKDFVCPALRGVAATLAANPNDPRGQLCLGEFIRTHGMDPDFYGATEFLDRPRGQGELGSASHPFPGKRFSRLDAYKRIIANPAAGAENRAYALHRAIRCYAPAGHNGCDDSEQPVAQRKAWFQQLKREYPTSPWSTRLTLYW